MSLDIEHSGKLGMSAITAPDSNTKIERELDTELKEQLAIAKAFFIDHIEPAIREIEKAHPQTPFGKTIHGEVEVYPHRRDDLPQIAIVQELRFPVGSSNLTDIQSEPGFQAVITDLDGGGMLEYATFTTTLVYTRIGDEWQRIVVASYFQPDLVDGRNPISRSSRIDLDSTQDKARLSDPYYHGGNDQYTVDAFNDWLAYSQSAAAADQPVVSFESWMQEQMESARLALSQGDIDTEIASLLSGVIRNGPEEIGIEEDELVYET